jgi:hypothetical protein
VTRLQGGACPTFQVSYAGGAELAFGNHKQGHHWHHSSIHDVETTSDPYLEPDLATWRTIWSLLSYHNNTSRVSDLPSNPNHRYKGLSTSLTERANGIKESC